MVLLQLTTPLQARLDKLLPLLPFELRHEVASYLVEDEEKRDGEGEALEGAEEALIEKKSGGKERTVSHEVLVQVSRWAKGREDLANSDDYRLASLLRLTDVHAPPLLPREKSAELLAILSSIQLRQDRLAYASLTSLAPAPHPSLISMTDVHDPAYHGGKAKTPAEEWKEIRREVGAILNVGASMLAVGTAVWWVGGGRSYAARLSLAMSGAVAIAAIEAFLYYRFFTRTEREKADLAKRKARGVAKRQAKTVASSLVAKKKQ